MEFAGQFETHLTVAVGTPGAADAPAEWAEWAGWAEWAAANGLKFVHIVVEGAAAPSQPMLTRWGRGTLSSQRREAEAVRRKLESAGFRVVRIKIEAAPGNDDVPRTDAEAAARGDGRYFEHHVKLLLPADADLERLRTLAAGHSARLSRNARRVRADGRSERFVTQHCRGVGDAEAGRRLALLMADLASADYAVLETEREYIVHDTNADLDAPAAVPAAEPTKG